MTAHVERGPMTPMYELLWNAVGRKIHFPSGMGIAGTLKVLSNRFAIAIGSNGQIAWFHICFPRKLYNMLNDLDERDEFTFGINWRTYFVEPSATRCGNCRHRLTDKERMMIKLGVLGVKR